jgi:hypothetical protein
MDENKHLEILAKCGLEQMDECYKPFKRAPKQSSILLFEELQQFISDYNKITVRQFYYHCISNGTAKFPQNNKEARNTYQNIDNAINRARLGGLIPMDSIADNTSLMGTQQWNSIDRIVRCAVDQYRSKWHKEQKYYVEVWLEKEALAQIFHSITDDYGVFLSVSGGYPKLSQIYSAKLRFQEYHDKPIKLLYFGDLDPSGKDMPRVIVEKFEELEVEDLKVIEVALNKYDVQKHNLPKNPFKPKDTRNKWYSKKYGIDYAVELDALEPDILEEKIRDSISEYVNLKALKDCKINDMLEIEKWNRIIVETKK